jgi:DNA-binding HxlR family transcriptional regulator
MTVYINEKIKEYANEMPYELRRAMEALNDDTRLAVFFVLLKYGELPFSQIMTELEIPPEYSSKLTYHIKKLQKSALVKNEYIKKEGVNSYSFYNLTEFGEELLNSLIDTIAVPRSKQPITTATESKSIDLEWPERISIGTTSSDKLEPIPLSINAA